MTEVARSQHNRSKVVAVIVAVAVLLCALFVPQSARGAVEPAPMIVYRATLDGVLLGYVESSNLAERAVRIVEEEETLRRGYAVALAGQFDVEQIETTRKLALLDTLSLYNRLSDVGQFDVMAVAIMIDEEPIVYLLNERSARNAVDRYIEQNREQLESSHLDYVTVTLESLDPVEKITYEEMVVASEDIRSIDEAVNFLLQGMDELVTYEVRSGDSMWGIASRNDLSVEDLQLANPDLIRPDQLQPGDQLQMSVPKPVISLESTELRETINPIPFQTEYKPDNNRWPWEERVIEPGQKGERRIVERLQRSHGEVINVELLEEEVLSEPVTRVIARGTKDAGVMGTGDFILPARGRLTSNFGYSSFRGRNHNGVDIAAPVGTPVYAADTGTVTRAGWYGNYGQTVIIDHGGGARTTLYAHLSAILVKVGDVVERGKQIGRIGSTGSSTGPHVHFEIHDRGRPINPMQFFK